MPWSTNITDEIADLFAEQSRFVTPEDGLGGWGSTIPAKVAEVAAGRPDRRYGCKRCGGDCVIMGRKWSHRRCLSCNPLRRTFDPEVFPCGHPRTDENTQLVNGKRPFKRCRACNRLKALAAYHARKR